jgi:hypothetical protein
MEHYGTLWGTIATLPTHTTGNISSFFEDGTRRKLAEQIQRNFFLVSLVVKWYLV